MTTTQAGPALAPYLQAQKSSRTSALLILTLVLNPLTLLLGSLLYGVTRLINRRWLWRVLAVVLLCSIAFAAWHWRAIVADAQALWASGQPVYQALQQTLAQSRRAASASTPTIWLPLLRDLAWSVIGVWRWGLLGIPLIALYLNGTKLRTAEEQEQHRIDLTEQVRRARAETAAKLSRRAPVAVKGQLVLGASVEGDLGWTMPPWAVYPPDVLGRHLVLIGASGQGKSETSLRLVAGAAQVYGWQVFVLDAKGDRALADRFWAALRAAGATKLAMLPQRPYDGWRGDATALLNRLMGVLSFSEPFYRDMTKLVLSLVVDAPQGPPRGSTELLARLHLDALKKLYADHPDLEALRTLTDEQVGAVYNRYRAFFRSLRGQLDGDWSWEDVDAGYLLLDGLALKDQAQSLGRFLLEDFAHYVAVRKDAAQRVLLLVDEFSALAIGGTDAASLFERVRSFGASVVVTSQSYAGLGDGADRILGATAAVLLHQCPDPAPLIARAGMERDLQLRRGATERVGLGGIKAYATGQVSLAERDTTKIRAELVQQLKPGECVLISGGRAQHLCVGQLQLPPASVAVAHQQIDVQPQPPRRVDRLRGNVPQVGDAGSPQPATPPTHAVADDKVEL
jgi:hypothetical protein